MITGRRPVPGEVVPRTPPWLQTPHPVRVSSEGNPLQHTPKVAKVSVPPLSVSHIVQEEIDAIDLWRQCQEEEENRACKFHEREICRREIEPDECMARIRLEIMNALLQNQMIRKRVEAMLDPLNLQSGQDVAGTPAGLGWPNPIHASTARKTMPEPRVGSVKSAQSPFSPVEEEDRVRDEYMTGRRGLRKAKAPEAHAHIAVGGANTGPRPHNLAWMQ